MTTIATPPGTTTLAPTAAAVPRRRTLVGLSATVFVLLAVGIATSKDPGDSASPATVMKDFDLSHAMVLTQLAIGIFCAAALVFYGAALMGALSARTRTWAGTVVACGFTLAAVAMLVSAMAPLWLWHAVDIGDASTVQAITIIDSGTFPALMLTFVTCFVGVGVTAFLTGQLPRWLCVVSIVVGVICPISVGGFVGFVLFPIWLVVVAAMVRLDPAPND